ncbi:MAG: GNAT family N-acetyltransferase [Mycobacterium leprae]
MTLQIRPWQIPADLEAVSAIASASFWSHVTPADILAGDRILPPQAIMHRVVAVNPAGRIAGYGTLRRDGYEEPRRFRIRVAVAVEQRRQGIGTALVAELEQWAYAHYGTGFEASFRDEPGFLAFARRHGYAVDMHQIGFILHVPRFDEAPFAAVIGRLEAEGIRFITLAEQPTAAFQRALYDLEALCNHDEPGYENETFPPFADWYRDVCANECRPLDCTIVALDGETPVALSGLVRDTDGNMRVAFTGVHPAYRGRSIALAVKLLAIRAAKRYGAAQLHTGSEERNAPMLHLNRRLGFDSHPGMYRCVKRQGIAGFPPVEG